MRYHLKFAMVMSIALLMVIVCAGATAQELTGAQQKLLAKRAAIVDAMRNLTEQVKGLQITSNTYVRDFVAESDEINTAVNDFIKGCKLIGEKYYDDGTCEVTMQVTIQQIIEEMTKISKTYGGHQEYVFQDIEQHAEKKVLTATGTGAPRQPEAAPAETTAPPAQSPPTYRAPAAEVPGWGNVSPQGRLMAQRAARVDALRNLAERVKGLQITSNTYVRDFVAESDEIKTDLDTFIKGARFGEYRYLPDGIVEVDAEVTIQRLIEELTRIVKSRPGSWSKTVFEDIQKYYDKKVISATGSGTVGQKYLGAQPQAETSKLASAPQQMPTWASGRIRETGSGVPPKDKDAAEARLMAERAAKLDAMRNLTERVHGLEIKGTTTVSDFVAQHDELKTKLNAVISNAKVTDTRYLNDGTVEIDMQVDLKDVYDAVKNYQ